MAFRYQKVNLAWIRKYRPETSGCAFISIVWSICAIFSGSLTDVHWIYMLPVVCAAFHLGGAFKALHCEIYHSRKYINKIIDEAWQDMYTVTGQAQRILREE